MLTLFSGCGRNETLPEGVITDNAAIELTTSGNCLFPFSYNNVSYGYIEFFGYSDGVRIKAPFGIFVNSVELDSAPLDSGSNYRTDEVLFEFGKFYFFRPDSVYYGKIIKKNEETKNDTLYIEFEWFIQTIKEGRDL